MNERDLWWKIAIVGGVMALAFAMVWPIDQKLKQGIDLAGGYSLLYEIDDTGMGAAEKADLSERVMRVLRERVDPKGVFNLVWRPVGTNRLEIQMPRPSEEIVEARRKYEEHQNQIQSTIVRRTDVLRALAKQGPDRAREFEQMVHGIPARAELLEKCAAAYDAVQTAQAEYDRRVAAINADNLAREDIDKAVSASLAERPAALDALVRNNPARRALLETAAKAWDELQAAKSTTQPAEGAGDQAAADALSTMHAKQVAYDEAVGAVLALNADPAKLSDGVTIDQVVALEEQFDAAMADALATNIDIGRLQVLLDAKPGESMREEGLADLKAKFPGLTGIIEGMVSAADRLKLQRRGEGRLEDPADLQRLLRGAGVLEFRILPSRDEASADVFAQYIEQLKTRGPRRMPGEENYQWFEIEDAADFLKMRDVEREFEARKASLPVIVERFGNKYYVLAHIGDNYTLTHRYGEADWSLKNARFDRDEIGRPAIGFTLDERGGDKFANLTRLNRGKQLAIFLDDQCISHATIEAVIRTQGIIHGSFTPQEVQDMVKKLDAGSLPRKLKDPPISVRAIGPSLGEANREAGLRSAKYGAILVLIFMVGIYFYAGGVAVFAVVMNLLLTLAVMSAMGATLTLPGIAGLVLSLGMAVDANVLINERIREELTRGNTMRMAIKLGYERAFTAIIDSNLTTLLTCLILYWVGSEEIKGFGLTLGIGVVLNLFTAYFVTRVFFEVMSLATVPTEVSRYPIFAALGVGGFGAVLYGLGYFWNDEFTREHSVLMLFGEALIEVAPAIIGLLILMFIFRAIHRSFQKGPKPNMPMVRLIGAPKIDWIGTRPLFFGFSFIISVLGLFCFFSLDKDEMYDIEFLGGTSAQIDLKEPGSLNQAEISERLAASGEKLDQFAAALRSATVSGSGGTFVIDCPGVPAARLEPIIKRVMDTEGNRVLSDVDGIRYADPGANQVTIRTRTELPDGTKTEVTLDNMKGYVEQFAVAFERAGESIARAQVQGVQGVGSSAVPGKSFEIVTLETNKEVVVGAIMDTMQSDLDIQPALTFDILEDTSSGGVPYFAIRDEDPRQLNLPISPEEKAQLDLRGWKGGVAIVLDRISPPQNLKVLKDRLRAMRLQPGFEGHGWRESDVFGLASASPGSDQYSRVMVVVADENFPLLDDQGNIASTWTSDLAEPEVALIQAALQRQTSLSQITQFDNQVSGEAQTTAIIAIVLSWLMIILYVWFRFGNIRWGLAAVVALVHDVIVAIGAVAVCHYIADTPIGKALLLDKFRVDLALVAAVMTVIGYSVNDTIVVFDRIRENRGRLKDLTPELVNDSISQTLARTLLTGMTTIFTILVMYIFGGPGIHGFNFVMFIGILTGTYSSFAVASQFLVKRAAATVRAR
ncbi:MAG: hypothetical protein DCC65_10140 [Planctomycetota bacterium]|nr:MAG: hypothetical protein DCC65_10140 [Planctomycetota bacterium]